MSGVFTAIFEKLDGVGVRVNKLWLPCIASYYILHVKKNLSTRSYICDFYCNIDFVTYVAFINFFNSVSWSKYIFFLRKCHKNLQQTFIFICDSHSIEQRQLCFFFVGVTVVLIVLRNNTIFQVNITIRSHVPKQRRISNKFIIIKINITKRSQVTLNYHYSNKQYQRGAGTKKGRRSHLMTTIQIDINRGGHVPKKIIVHTK